MLGDDWISEKVEMLVLGLIQGGLNPRVRDTKGRTLLHLRRHAEVYDALVAAGADPTAMDFNERLPERPAKTLAD